MISYAVWVKQAKKDRFGNTKDSYFGHLVTLAKAPVTW